MSEDRKERIKKLFDNYDENKNGILEKEELVNGLRELICCLGDSLSQEKVDEIAEEAIINFDLDGNGKIDLQEFTNLINFFIEEKGLKI